MSGCYYTDEEIASMEAQHAEVCAERNRLTWLIRQLLQDLPEQRCWFNPDIEREMRARCLPPKPSAEQS